MTTRFPNTGPAGATHHISGPSELLQAVPYLLGFHPRRSLVLIGLSGDTLVVTARLDLDDAVVRDVLWSSLHSMCAGGTTEVIAAVYDDGPADALNTFADDPPPWWQLCLEVEGVVDELACRLLDVLFVAGERWWSYSCAEDRCCPVEGNLVPAASSSFVAAAILGGIVPLPDRESMAGLLDPLPEAARAALDPAIADAENEVHAAAIGARTEHRERSLKRKLFAAARGSAQPRWTPPDDAAAARFTVGLVQTALRDAVWMAVDDRRLDGRELWRDLARRVPSPYDAAPLFLFGWASWRAGNSALAGIAVDRALASAPGYHAADLLQAALSQNVDPRRMPRLRRSA